MVHEQRQIGGARRPRGGNVETARWAVSAVVEDDAVVGRIGGMPTTKTGARKGRPYNNIRAIRGRARIRLRRNPFPRRVVALHVLVQNALELFGDVVAAQRREVLAIHIHGRLGFLEGAGQRDPDVGMP